MEESDSIRIVWLDFSLYFYGVDDLDFRFILGKLLGCWNRLELEFLLWKGDRSLGDLS